MSKPQNSLVRLGAWTFDPASGELEHPAYPSGHHAEGQSLRILRVLASSRNKFVSRSALLDAGWGGGHVEPNTFQKAIGNVRKLFLDDPTISIKHRADVGYCLHAREPEPIPSSDREAPASGRSEQDRVFKGRDQELDLLDRAWASPQTRVVVVAAVGGAGKSTLVAKWKSRLLSRAHSGDPVLHFEWSFYNQGTNDRASSDEFFNAALQTFGTEADGKQASSPWAKGLRLAALVAAKRSLLVLDGLEPLQGPPDHRGEATLRDQALAAFLGDLAVNNPGLCVVTSRTKIRDAQRWPEQAVLQHELGPLADAEGASVLRSYGVKGSDEELADASRAVRGHALTLSLMGGYLRVAFADHAHISRRDTFGFKSADDETQGGHAFRVVAAYETLLEKSGRQVELSILRLLGLFDRPATPGCVTALKRAAIRNLTDVLADVPDRAWSVALHYLEALGLIETKAWSYPRITGYPEDLARKAMAAAARNEEFALGPPQDFDTLPGTLVSGPAIDAHPLVREYFALRIDGPAARAAHGQLCEHLAKSVPFWPEGSEGLYVLYQAIAHGCRAGRHQEVYERVFDDRVQRGLEGPHAFYSRTRGLPEMDLVALKDFFVEPWARLVPGLDPATQGRVVTEAGFRLRTLNRLHEAKSLLEEGVRLAELTSDSGKLAQYACTLSELHLLLGEVPAAVGAAAMSVAYADRSAKPRLRAVRRASYGDALHCQGRIDESKRLFAEAETVAPATLLDGRYLDGLRSAQYCDLWLREAERAAWRVYLWHRAREHGQVAPRPDGTDGATFRDLLAAAEARATRTLQHASANNALLDQALDRLTLGRTEAYGALLAPRIAGSALARALRLVEESAAGLRGAGRRDFEPSALVTKAWLKDLTGATSEADTCLEEALRIAEDGAMRLHLADVHLHRARLRCDRRALRGARHLVEECGYLRRLPELRDAEEAARSWTGS